MKWLDFLRNWTLPVAIVTGTVAYLTFDLLPPLAGAAQVMGVFFDHFFPITIFLTLFTTFVRIDYHALRPHRWHAVLLLAQVGLVAVLCSVVWLCGEGRMQGRLLTEAMLACVIAPCASAAPVVTGKLGGNMAQMTLFTLLSGAWATVCIPLVFPMLEREADITFLQAFLMIAQQVAAIILLPLVLGWTVRHYMPRLRDWLIARRNLPFYMWAVSLAITTGITVKNIMHTPATPWLLLSIAAMSAVVCALQFGLGRCIGRRWGDKVCCGQGMFQKNTGLAIWVTYMYLDPVASVGAGCYVLWQNIVNSLELWAYRKGRF